MKTTNNRNCRMSKFQSSQRKIPSIEVISGKYFLIDIEILFNETGFMIPQIFKR